jgi:hypothetical protein
MGRFVRADVNATQAHDTFGLVDYRPLSGLQIFSGNYAHGADLGAALAGKLLAAFSPYFNIYGSKTGNKGKDRAHRTKRAAPEAFGTQVHGRDQGNDRKFGTPQSRLYSIAPAHNPYGADSAESLISYHGAGRCRTRENAVLAVAVG